MNTSLRIARISTALLGATLLLGVADLHAQTLAFPSAMGFGRNTVGGRGGAVCHVNSTSGGTSGSVVDAGNNIYAGTLPYCLRSVNGPRTIVFDVSGRINIPNQLGRNDGTDPNYTLACQTAPNPGVYFAQGSYIIDQNQVIMRHCRFRHGASSTDGFASLQVGDTTNPQPNDIIIDHASITYHRDETFNVVMNNGHEPCIYRNNGNCIDRVTLQWSIVAEGLGTNRTNTDTDSKCFLVNGVRGLSVINNIVANCSYRMPQQYDGEVEYINNVWYNSGNGNPGVIEAYWDVAHYSIVGNYWMRGPSGGSSNALKWGTGGSSTYKNLMTIYVEGNRHVTQRANDTLPEEAIFAGTLSTAQRNRLISKPRSGFMQSGWTTAEQALSDVIAAEGAGSWAPSLDSVDAGNRADVASNGSAGAIPRDLSNTNGGYPSFSVNSRPASFDTDGDGMPNAWETANGLNPNNAADGRALSGNGWTNLENYLNQLAGDVVPGASAGDNDRPLPPSNVTITP